MAYLEKVLKYVDTVKAGKPVISVSIIDQAFPKEPDEVNWPSVTRSITFYVRFEEDSLKKGKVYVDKVRLNPSGPNSFL